MSEALRRLDPLVVAVDHDGRAVGVVSMREQFGRLTEALDAAS